MRSLPGYSGTPCRKAPGDQVFGQIREERLFWGHSSVGRAPALQAGCRRFESVWLHQ